MRRSAPQGWPTRPSSSRPGHRFRRMSGSGSGMPAGRGDLRPCSSGQPDRYAAPHARTVPGEGAGKPVCRTPPAQAHRSSASPHPRPRGQAGARGATAPASSALITRASTPTPSPEAPAGRRPTPPQRHGNEPRQGGQLSAPAAAMRLIARRSQNSSVSLFPAFREYLGPSRGLLAFSGRSVF